MRAIVVVPLLALLMGCGPTPAELHAADSGQCASFGFWAGSPEFAHCMMEQNRQRQDNLAADRRAAQRNLMLQTQFNLDRQAREDARRKADGDRVRRDNCLRNPNSLYCG